MSCQLLVVDEPVAGERPVRCEPAEARRPPVSFRSLNVAPGGKAGAERSHNVRTVALAERCACVRRRLFADAHYRPSAGKCTDKRFAMVRHFDSEIETIFVDAYRRHARK